MILVFEMNWTGTVHAPGNAATLQTFVHGCPEQQIRVFAEQAHIDELQRDPALNGLRTISYGPIAIYPHHQGKPGIVSWGRFCLEFRTIRTAVQAVPAGTPCLIVLISTTSTGIYAAALAASLRRNTYVQIGLHGDLNEINTHRSRNPLSRAFDLTSAMTRNWRTLRFLVLEEAIKDELATMAPAAAARTDVLPLPINISEVSADIEVSLSYPLRIGFVGQATLAKGIDIFLEIAREMTERHPGRLEFFVIGRAYPGAEMPDFSVLAHPIATDYLAREQFMRMISELHYVFLPFQGDYYRLAASGALIDAVTWLKPIIAGELPIVANWFNTFGDIGYLCVDPAAMRDQIDNIVQTLDSEHYRRQVDALRHARGSRTPELLGRRYRDIVAAAFPKLIARR